MENWRDDTDYALSDFLLFGPEAYWGLFAQQNAALGLWLLLPVLLGLTGLIALPVANSNRIRMAFGCFALCWIGAAHFMFTDYASINWAIAPLGWVFLLQAGLLCVASMFWRSPTLGKAGGTTWSTLGGTPRSARALPSVSLFALGAVLYPLAGLAFGRPLSQAEIIGLAPDATAIATLGFLAMQIPNRVSLGLAIIPVLWCGLSAMTLFALGSHQGWLLVSGVCLWGFALWLQRHGASEGPHTGPNQAGER
jgi:hypothetical protein